MSADAWVRWRNRRVVRLIRIALRPPRQLLGRLRYTLSAQLDGNPDDLIAGALTHAALSARTPICLATSFALSSREIERLTEEKQVNGIVSKHGPLEIELLRKDIPGANLGHYMEPGVWSLPPGAAHVYFVGSWRLITAAMLREALRLDLRSLTVRCGGRWVGVPLPMVRRMAASRAHERVIRFAARPRRLDAARLMGMIAGAAGKGGRDFVPGRVVLACSNLSPGGAERQAAYTARGLARTAGIESVELLCDTLEPGLPAGYDFYLPLLQQAGVSVRTLERAILERSQVREPAALRRCVGCLPEGFLLDVANLHRAFIRLRPEVVHAWLDWSNTRAGLAAALAGVPRIVLSGRNLNPTHFALYQPYMDPVYEALCALPGVVLLNNSCAGADSYAAWLRLPRDRIKVIYNGLDMAPIAGEAGLEVRRRLGIPQDAPLVGGVFRFYPEKRPLLWVEVAARVIRANPESWFVLFGQGILEQDIAEMARRRGIADRLLMPGITGEVLSVMRALDVFLLTSSGEGVPNVVIEAQWAGTPVVATRAGGVAEALELGVSGWIVDPPDPDRLAGCVNRLLADPGARSRARAAGPELVRARFGLQRMIDETVQVYGLGGDPPVASPGDCRPASADRAEDGSIRPDLYSPETKDAANSSEPEKAVR
jgi:glycosyltransferase involved in cell wall biosynthesis